MKTFNKIFLLTAILFGALSLQSCDDDIARTLEGTWSGNMYVQSYYNGYYYPASHSVINFQRNPFKYSSGKGYWIDYYSNAPWGYIANHIDWKVSNGTIHIYFYEDNDEIAIYDYRLNDEYFEGYINTTSGRTFFSLVHIDSPNWTDYSYGWNDYYSYSLQSSKEKDNQKAPKRVFMKTEQQP